MAIRKRNKSLQEDLNTYAYCVSCRWNKGKYYEHEQLGTYTAVRFKCLHCGHIIVHFYHNSKVKGINFNASEE